MVPCLRRIVEDLSLCIVAGRGEDDVIQALLRKRGIRDQFVQLVDVLPVVIAVVEAKRILGHVWLESIEVIGELGKLERHLRSPAVVRELTLCVTRQIS
jgi:hypothetical protein